MNKQKTLIFLLSAMLFLTASFLVYSWSEPVTEMPGTYTPPINTSATAQTKSGDFSATSFIDSNDSNYYLNPSGNSVVSGTIKADRPTLADELTTKGYVDEMISAVEAIVTGAQPLVNGAHSQDECTTAKGEVVASDVSFNQCRFNSKTCPSGWTAYKNFRTVGVQVSNTVWTAAKLLQNNCINYGISCGASYGACACNLIYNTLSWGNNPYRCASCGCACSACGTCTMSQMETTDTNTQIGCY